MSADIRIMEELREDISRVEMQYKGAKYMQNVENFRTREYPQLTGITYLDHAATTLYSSSLIDTISSDLKSNLFGNPHSLSPSSLATTRRIEDVRVRVLQLFNADPDHFDLVFCANATAAIKIVAEGFAAYAEAEGQSFDYRVHEDSHTSLVGIRPLASDSLTFTSDEMEEFVQSKGISRVVGLMAYPAQSNMSGERPPLSWTEELRRNRPGWYTLLDAAALVTTSPLDLGNHESAPDFVAISFYKMFGYPDLGGLIVRKSSASVLQQRRYFGGGTVSFIMNPREHPSASNCHSLKKTGPPHEYLEDGTVAFHSIIALDHAISNHRQLYGNFEAISRHTQALSGLLFTQLQSRRHQNGAPVVELYMNASPGENSKQGPTLAMNFKRSDGSYVGFNDVMKLASVRNIHLRTGGLCNPGGVMKWMDLSEADMRRNLAAGKRCGDEWDIMDRKPTGAIRISLGAMSILEDVANFLSFVDEFYVEKVMPANSLDLHISYPGTAKITRISIYPVKSCAAFNIPPEKSWKIASSGLEYDREFCLLHQGTGKVMDMKSYPKMALIRPFVDPERSQLTLSSKLANSELKISLKDDIRSHSHVITKKCNSKVCGDSIVVQAYSDERISLWFTNALGVPCTLARYPSSPDGGGRFVKNHLTSNRQSGQIPLALRNESPILVVNKRSLDTINSVITKKGGKEAEISVFRSNIVVEGLEPFDEDKWLQLEIPGSGSLQILGPCRRCHMICIDQETAERSPEPFVTLSKLRATNGKVYFGQHGTFLQDRIGGGKDEGWIRVGDSIDVSYEVELGTSDSDSGESAGTAATTSTTDTVLSYYDSASAATCVIV